MDTNSLSSVQTENENPSVTQQMQQAFLDYVSIINKYSKTNSSLTIKGEILEELASDIHQYKISYGGAVYTNVYGGPNSNYAVSSVVYILVPNGDFNERMFILGCITPSATDYITESRSDSYISLGDNLLGDIIRKDGEQIITLDGIHLQSWVDQNKGFNFSKEPYFETTFRDYLLSYRTFKFSAAVQTNIDLNHRGQGQYGLLLSIPFINEKTGEERLETYSMTTDNMEGNVYDFSKFAKQEMYFTVSDDFTYDSGKQVMLSAFVKDFHYTDEDIEAKDPNEYDIFFKDISLEMVDVLSETAANGYHLTITASDGNYFLQGVYAEEKTLRPVLKYKGKTISTNDWDCYWFVENSAVTPTHPYYLQLGGRRWECKNPRTYVESSEDGIGSYQYVTTDMDYTITTDDVKNSLRYQCVLTKTFQDKKELNDDNSVVTEHTEIIRAYILIKNLDSRTTVSVYTPSGSNTVIENIGDVHLIARIKTDCPIVTNPSSEKIEGYEEVGGYDVAWQRFNKNGYSLSNEDDQGNEKNFYTLYQPIHLVSQGEEDLGIIGTTKVMLYTYEIEINFPSSIIQGSNTFVCTFYRKGLTKDETINIGSDSITITTTKEANYILNITDADVAYKYDSDGDAPTDNVYYDGKTKVKIIQPFSYQLFKPDGHELTDTEYKLVKFKWWFPIDSLMVLNDTQTGITGTETINNNTYYIIEGNGRSQIGYKLRETYSKRQAENNTIRLEVTFNKNTFSAVANPKLLKDGEGGTNGSKYVAIITCDGYAYDEEDLDKVRRKLHLVYAQNGEGSLDAKGNKIEGTGIWYNYRYNPDTKKNELIKFENSVPTFNVIVYKNNYPMNNSEIKEKHWQMFDSENKQKTGYCNIDNNGKLSIRSKWNDKSVSPCDIVECELTFKNEESTLGISNEEIVRAYYPIEMTYIPTSPSEAELKNNPDMYIPILEGGFDEVLYDLDGNNPDYDNEEFKFYDAPVYNEKGEVVYNDDKTIKTEAVSFAHNFRCIDNISRTSLNELNQTFLYNYIWIVGDYDYADESSTIRVKNFKEPDVRKAANGVTYPFAKIVPATKYNFGQSANYIRVEYELLDSAKKALNDEADRLQNAKDEANKFAKYYEINKINMDLINDIINSETNGISTWIKDLNNYKNEKIKTKTFLNHIDSAFKALKNSLNDIQQIYNYGNNYIKASNNYPYESLCQSANSDLNTLYQQLYLLGLGNYDLSIISQYTDVDHFNPSGSNFSKNKLNDLDTLITQWKSDLSILNKYIGKIIDRVDPDNLESEFLYSNEYEKLSNFKKRFFELLNSDEYSGLSGSDKANYYDNNEKPIVTATEIDTLIHDTTGIINRLNPQVENDFDYNIKNDESRRLENYNDFITKLIDPIKDIFNKIYESKEFTEKHYNDIQKIFDDLTDKYDKNIAKYKSLANDSFNNTNFVHIKPVHMSTNGAGLGYLNDWDGSRLYTDPNNSEYILAPIVGAGAKIDGSFTGVVMGTRELNHTRGGKKNQRIGLHGMSDNTSTFFINARDGSAIFGKSGGGQIIIDPTNDPSSSQALLYSSNYIISDSKVDGDNQGKPSNYDNFGTASVNGYQRHGMLINLSAPYIHFADANGYIYSGDHKPIGDDKNIGFYLSHKGLSIQGTYPDNQGNKVTSRLEMNTEGPPKFYSGNHSTLNDNKNNGFYLGDDGLSIRGSYKIKHDDGKEEEIVNRFEISTNSAYPKIYSNNHYDITQTNPGFYLGNDGLSIGSDFVIAADGGATIGNGNSTIGGWKVRTKKDDEGKDIPIGFVSATNSGILLNSNSSTIVLGSDAGKIYSGKHTTLNDKDKGFYISNDGMSIWNMFRVQQKEDRIGNPIKGTGEILIGNLSNKTKYWTIGGVVPNYTKHWLQTRVNGLQYTKSSAIAVNKEFLKTQDTPFIPYKGDGATFMTATRKIQQGDYFMAEEIYPEVMNYYDEYVASGGTIPWPYPVPPSAVLYIRPNCRVSEGEDGKGRESEKYELVPEGTPSSWESYMAYNTDNIYVSSSKEMDLLSGKDYSVLNFDEGSKKAQVYIGTNGLRIGKCFAVDIEGNGIFKGNINADHGTIGGWSISEDGLYHRLGKTKTKAVALDTVDHPDDKVTLPFEKIFLLSKDGEIGVSYLYAGSQTITAYYEDGTDTKVPKKIKPYEYIGNSLTQAWFNEDDWHGFADGTFDVYADDSHFGAGLWTHGGGKTYFDGQFAENAASRIRGIVFTGTWRSVHESASDSSPTIGYVQI